MCAENGEANSPQQASNSNYSPKMIRDSQSEGQFPLKSNRRHARMIR